MNLDRHLDSFRGLFTDLVDDDVEAADATKSFYEEYFAVCDLPAEFYWKPCGTCSRSTRCHAAS